MVLMVAHGGRCCGARHIHSFGAAEERDPNLIDRALSTVELGRMVEVILNGTQVANSPNTLRRLAELGFVFDGHWINNNHGSHNYSFRRMDKRLPLRLQGWSGMTVSTGLEGDLPNHRDAPHAVAISALVYQAPVNSVVRVGGISQHAGRGMFIRRTRADFVVGGGLNNLDDCNRISLAEAANGPEVCRLVYTSLALVRVDQAEAAVPEGFHNQRHRNGEQARIEPTVVFHTYHNVTRAGVRGAGYDSYVEAVANRGRRTRIDDREVYSNGRINWREDVTA